MAGLWEHWMGADGSEIASCSIIVTDANALLAPIHDRMPVILDSADYDAWLDPGTATRQRCWSCLDLPIPPVGRPTRYHER